MQSSDVFLSSQQNPLPQRNHTQSLEEQKRCSQGPGKRASAAEVGQESRGRGLSVHLHNRDQMQTIYFQVKAIDFL